MVSAQGRREQVAYARERGLSCRRACALLSVARSALRYEHRMPQKDAELASKLRAAALRYPRWGYRPIRHVVSTPESPVSFNRVYRVWRKEGLGQPRRRPRKRIRGDGHRWMSAIAPNGVWAYDFVFDECANTQKLKCLVVVDEWTKESLAIEVDGRISSTRVIEVLERLVSLYGAPAFLRSDNGPEFVAKAVQRWLRAEGISTSYIEPGRPWQNGVVESFNARFRAECLNAEWFIDRREARETIEKWRQQYNEERPHSSIEFEVPASRRRSWMESSNWRLWIVEKTNQQAPGLSN